MQPQVTKFKVGDVWFPLLDKPFELPAGGEVFSGRVHPRLFAIYTPQLIQKMGYENKAAFLNQLLMSFALGYLNIKGERYSNAEYLEKIQRLESDLKAQNEERIQLLEDVNSLKKELDGAYAQLAVAKTQINAGVPSVNTVHEVVNRSFTEADNSSITALSQLTENTVNSPEPALYGNEHEGITDLEIIQTLKEEKQALDEENTELIETHKVDQEKVAALSQKIEIYRHAIPSGIATLRRQLLEYNRPGIEIFEDKHWHDVFEFYLNPPTDAVSTN